MNTHQENIDLANATGTVPGQPFDVFEIQSTYVAATFPRAKQKFTLETVANALNTPGPITHIEVDHNTGTVTVYFIGNQKVAEGQEAFQYYANPNRNR